MRRRLIDRAAPAPSCDSVRPGGFEPATRGLEVRRSVTRVRRRDRRLVSLVVANADDHASTATAPRVYRASREGCMKTHASTAVSSSTLMHARPEIVDRHPFTATVMASYPRLGDFAVHHRILEGDGCALRFSSNDATRPARRPSGRAGA